MTSIRDAAPGGPDYAGEVDHALLIACLVADFDAFALHTSSTSLRALLPLCPEEAVGPIKDALSQVQMLYVKESSPKEDPPPPESKIWTPGS